MKHLRHATTPVKPRAPVRFDVAFQIELFIWRRCLFDQLSSDTTIARRWNLPLVELLIQTINSTLIYQQKHFQDLVSCKFQEERYES